jgi:ABC-type glycerol-3-phosphate transport system substrate-binding protein
VSFDIQSPLPPRRINVEEEPVETTPTLDQSTSTEPPTSLTPSTSETEAPQENMMMGQPIEEKKKFNWGLIIFPVLVIALIGIALVLVKNIGSKVTGSGETTLTYWGLWENSAVMEGAIADFEAKNPNIKVKYVKNEKNDYRSRLQNRLSKDPTQNEVPDIFRYHASWIPMFRADLEKVPGNTVSSLGLETDFYEVFKKDLKSSGSWLGIPLMYDGLAMYYNRDLVESAGKSIPRTWWDLKETAQDLTVKDEVGGIKVAGVAMGLADNVDHFSDILGLLLRQSGVDITNLGTDTTKLANVLQFYTNFRTEYGTWDETLAASTVQFANNKLAFYFGPSWRSFNIDEINPGLNYEIANLPQLPTLENIPLDQPVSDENLTNIYWATYWAEGVNPRSKNQAAAWKLLEYLASKEGLTKMYMAAAQQRSFGEIYPRISLKSTMDENTRTKAFVGVANLAQSGYLSSRTWDGEGGINDTMANYFKDAINSLTMGNGEMKPTVETLVSGITQVKERFRLGQ